MNETLTVLLESLVIGGLIGFGASAGVARMFHAPKVQGMGAFRTLGELNACQNDPVAHFSFGLGFLFNAWSSAVGTGALTSDVDHRIVPHWSAAVAMAKNRNLDATLHNPRRMALTGTVVGMLLVTLLNTTAASIPHSLQEVASQVLGPASEWLINPVMPIIFWMAAVDAGRRAGAWGTVLGGLGHLVMGNAVPGIVLGIVIAKGVDDLGWTKVTKSLAGVVIVLFVASTFLRGVDITLLEQMKVHVPHWLLQFHDATGTKPQ